MLKDNAVRTVLYHLLFICLLHGVYKTIKGKVEEGKLSKQKAIEEIVQKWKIQINNFMIDSGIFQNMTFSATCRVMNPSEDLKIPRV